MFSMRHPVWNGLYLIPKLRRWLRWQLWPLRLRSRLEFQFLFFPSFLKPGLNQTGYFFALLEPEAFVSVANFIHFCKIQRFCKPFEIVELVWWYMQSKSFILTNIKWCIFLTVENTRLHRDEHDNIDDQHVQVQGWIVVMNA